VGNNQLSVAPRRNIKPDQGFKDGVKPPISLDPQSKSNAIKSGSLFID
jgi:hypothetical protein